MPSRSKRRTKTPDIIREYIEGESPEEIEKARKVDTPPRVRDHGPGSHRRGKPRGRP